MNEKIIQQLVDINNRFYQNFGGAFSETRQRYQSGVDRIVKQYIRDGDWLDIGCGNGVLGGCLAQNRLKGSYVGLDFSEPFLTEAIKRADSLEPHPGFDLSYQSCNLLTDDLIHVTGGRNFDGILAFAALHHLPGAEVRKRLLDQVFALLKPGGLFIHSEWQFQHNPKLVARIQPWSTVGLTDEDLEPGDTLLDWRHFSGVQANGPALRYVHLFSRPELADLAGETGFAIIDEFDSDGVTGNLGLYQVWQKKS